MRSLSFFEFCKGFFDEPEELLLVHILDLGAILGAEVTGPSAFGDAAGGVEVLLVLSVDDDVEDGITFLDGRLESNDEVESQNLVEPGPASNEKRVFVREGVVSDSDAVLLRFLCKLSKQSLRGGDLFSIYFWHEFPPCLM